eukprot:2894209-Alexandrium_andersonii.AAC.1
MPALRWRAAKPLACLLSRFTSWTAVQTQSCRFPRSRSAFSLRRMEAALMVPPTRQGSTCRRH